LADSLPRLLDRKIKVNVGINKEFLIGTGFRQLKSPLPEATWFPVPLQTSKIKVRQVSQFAERPVENGTGTLSKVFLTTFAYVLLTLSVRGATWYVDSSLNTSGNGQSWASAFKTVQEGSNHALAGDTVYISGGPSGSTRSYSISSWAPAQGTFGNPITYQIGQDSAHNGTAIFIGSGTLLTGEPDNVTISGDAGDGLMHLQLTGYNGILYGNPDNLNHFHFCYSNMGNASLGQNCWQLGWYVNNIEIDHMYCKVTSSSDSWFWCKGTSATTWDSVKLHDLTLILPKTPPGGPYADGQADDGMDGLDEGGTGYTIYNNYIEGYFMPGYYWAQHQDGIQTLGGSYWRIYNNTFVNLATMCIYLDSTGNSFDHFNIYNNIVVGNEPHVNGITLQPEGGAGSYSRINVLNNILQNSTIYAAGTKSAWINNLFENNIIIDGSIVSPATTSANVTLTAAQTATMFNSYSSSSTSNDFHLKATATTLIGQGINESAYFTTDRDGVTRPSVGAWDIGPYQFTIGGPGGNPLIKVSPASLTFSAVAVNATATNYFMVQNVGGGTLAGTAALVAGNKGFQIISGAAYSLSANQSQVVQVTYTPNGTNATSQDITFSGGGGFITTLSAAH
jgi:hypothetical protein